VNPLEPVLQFNRNRYQRSVLATVLGLMYLFLLAFVFLGWLAWLAVRGTWRLWRRRR
jgi:hypothetical protein